MFKSKMLLTHKLFTHLFRDSKYSPNNKLAYSDSLWDIKTMYVEGSQA